MKKELPAKYYLAHFKELIGFVSDKCMHLLEQKHITFINKINTLDEQSQCMLARIYSRKPYLVQTQSLNYEEIISPYQSLFNLKTAGLICEPSQADAKQLLSHLTKPALIELLAQQELPPLFKKSAAKSCLVEVAISFFESKPERLSHLYNQYVINNRDECYQYFEFLYIGRLSAGDVNHQNRFVLRDLGVTPVRQGHNESLSRFDSIEEAQSNYVLNRFRLAVKNAKDDNENETLAKQLINELAVGVVARELKNKLLIILYKQLKTTNPVLAFDVLNACEDDAHALEIQIREQYRLGNKEWVKAQLEKIIENPLTDELLYFADDFLMRKFNKQTRSRLSEMLASTRCIIEVDELYRGDVELGVSDHYTRQGKHVFYTENTLWQSLFALVFWQELFIETPTPPCNEFDIYPQALKTDTFYLNQSSQVEARLAACNSTQKLLRLVCNHSAKYYDQSNGLFRWHKDVLKPLEMLILNSPINALLSHLKNMAKNYRQLKDGYPDLMIVDNSAVHFEEVKAPGDKLKRNQLVSIDNLKNIGFKVNIAAVKWYVDPNRIYSVVDIETTGGLKGGNRITEIGIVKVKQGEIVDTWTTLINPERPIPRFITKLTGINDAMVSNAPIFSEIAAPLLNQLSGSIFVAHNVNFDYGFIKKELERIGINFKMPKLCTVVESRKAFKGLKSYSLGNLSAHFNLDLTNHHRALDDAKAAAQLLLLVQQTGSQ
ncbi:MULTISPECIES: exonuclease domain-containing protein [unclassified Pseudoalteromonas]|uniref:exonuclease domain-containing protein n=1 Tax=unclassified Pseudoalteromonas TaxID=194690 RepID=UPI0009784B6B|nr:MULTISPECIES: exonuclease domain-containing protein [unclassified Pseudoalteromonas]MDN3488656.1 exonuclease domain-containing protein [Pseudoalteromonas sp. APC 3694]